MALEVSYGLEIVMKVTCDRRELHEGLQTVGRAVSGRSSLPTLGNVVPEPSGEALRLAATDPSLGIDGAAARSRDRGKRRSRGDHPGPRPERAEPGIGGRDGSVCTGSAG